MNQTQRIAKDDPERIVLSNIAEYGWHAVNVAESILRLAGLFVRPCTRPAPAAQRRDSGPPPGFFGVAPMNPLSLPCDKAIP